MSSPAERLACLCLTGPTATGKTELALGLAERFPVEIVSMDSALVYRGLDIGTAKPDPAVRASVPHHLIDILDPSERYSAGRFRRDAIAAIAAIRERDRIPLVVGGTLLYLRALIEGLAELPEGAAALRARLDREGAAHGWPEMHRRLAAVDPAAAARIAPTDRQRIQRALEVYELTGRPLSAYHGPGRVDAPPVPGDGAAAASAGPDPAPGDPPAGRPARVDASVLALVPEDRDALKRRIERRFDAMIARGFLAEVENLRARGNLSPSLPSIRSVGYRQLWQYLDGELDWAEARARAIAATRQLAKRQLTWLRSLEPCTRLAADGTGVTERVHAWFEAEVARRFAAPMC